jgi:hypothetical protein
MEICSNCGYENLDTSKYCASCGQALFQPVIRNSVKEHLTYSYEILKKNPRILIPQFIISMLSIIFALYLAVLFSEGVFDSFFSNLDASGDFSIFIYTIVLGGISFISLFVFSMFFSPFLQHVYLTAAQGKDVDFNISYQYVRERIGEFVKAQLSILLILVVPFSFMGFLIIMGGGSGFVTFIYAMIGLSLIVALVLILFLQLAIEVMVWENTGFRPAIRLAYRFFIDRFGMNFQIGIIAGVIGWIVSLIPLHGFFDFILNIYFSIVMIDIYLNYRIVKLND